jgi:transcriptional regulator GlxA family with amidase domain
MPRPHRMALLAFDGFQLLDVTGPAAVFGAANDRLGRRAYDLQIVSSRGGRVPSSSGVAVDSVALAGLAARGIGTLLIAGGEESALRAAIADPAIRRWVPRCAERAARFGSVCTGTFVLAALGLVDGRRVTTHWGGCAQLAAMFPALRVNPEALYVVDGRVWTSAGVTTGIDMALAMVERDLGAEIANAIARNLVLYARRPGNQSQFSPLLRAQIRADTPLAGLIAWMQANLDQSLDVPSLAARAGLSQRSFHRRFVEATGETPARFVATLRLEAARTLLARGMPLKAIAREVGLPSAARLSAAFDRRFGVSPALFRAMHREARPAVE